MYFVFSFTNHNLASLVFIFSQNPQCPTGYKMASFGVCYMLIRSEIDFPSSWSTCNERRGQPFEIWGDGSLYKLNTAIEEGLFNLNAGEAIQTQVKRDLNDYNQRFFIEGIGPLKDDSLSNLTLGEVNDTNYDCMQIQYQSL